MGNLRSAMLSTDAPVPARPMTSPTPAPPVPAFPPEPWRQATVPPAPPEGDLDFSCPRCGEDCQAPAYGPCPRCRSELRDRLGGEQRAVAQEDYVPKMNVTPNAVALKD